MQSPRFPSGTPDDRRPSRRQRVAAAGAALAFAGASHIHAAAAAAEPTQTGERVIKNGRIKQSVVHWCFQDHWDVDRTCQTMKQLGGQSVELVGPEHWPTLKKLG